jgi:prepilin-type N-terminal cleavage/methylation domain-containing protein
MKLFFRKPHGFALIELLVCIVVVGVLGWTLVLFTGHALMMGQMTGTLNNARQLHFATETMTRDTKAAKGNGMEWTMMVLNGKTTPVSLAAYLDRFVQQNYLTKADVRILLCAPGKCPADDCSASKIAFKIFQFDDASPADQPFVVTANWTPMGLESGAPYGRKGFVVFAKGGSGGIYRRPEDATSPSIFPTGSKDGHAYRYVTLE